jgi:hypothetical protein
MAALHQLLPRGGRHVFLEEGADLLTKRHFFLAESEIHRILL